MSFVTIVFTDVVESSSTKRALSLGRDDRERDRAYLEGIQTPHFKLVRTCCSSHHGHEVSTSGDSFYLTFDDPAEAVRCAVDIQKRLAIEPIKTPNGPLRLRIGIHSGFPERYEGSLHGTDVDTAARVEAAATAGQILLSSITHGLTGHMTDVKFRSIGEATLKGVERIVLWEALWNGEFPRTKPETIGPSANSQEQKHEASLAGVVAQTKVRLKPYLNIGTAAVLLLVLALAATYQKIENRLPWLRDQSLRCLVSFPF
jgi:class 3 adenylate cyclase